MSTNIVQNVVNFTDQYVLMPYRNSSVVAALGDNRKFKFSLFGEATAVREINGVNAKSYDDATGWSDAAETINPWKQFTANIDREISFRLDLLKETNTILPGMIPTGELTYEASWRLLGAEIDAVSMGILDSHVADGNKIANTTDGYDTSADGIVDTLTNIEAWITNKKVYGGAAVFMSASVFKNLRTAMINKYGLASGAMLRPVDSVANPVDRKVGESGRVLEVVTEIYRWGDLFIYVIPDDRMINKVILLDGKSAGQTAGGWVADTEDADFHHIDMMVVPFNAAAIGVRHIIKEVMVPSVYRNYTPTGAQLEQELAKLAESYNNVINIQNIGITQMGDMFRWVGRVRWGLPVFSNWAGTILEIYAPAAPATPTVSGVTATPDAVGSAGGAVVVSVAGTDLADGLTVGAYSDTTLVGTSAKSAGDDKTQYATLTIPANTGASRELTVKVFVGESADTHTATVTQAAPAAAPEISGVVATPDTLAVAGGSVIVTVAGTNLTDGISVGAYNDDTLVGSAVETVGGATAQYATLTIPENTTGDALTLTVKASIDGVADTHTDTITQAGT